jgi:hypothetical protein
MAYRSKHDRSYVMAVHRIVARLKAWTVNPVEYGPDDDKKKVAEEVDLHAVYESDKSQPNWSFSTATPSAQLKMHISNPDAWGFFQKGVEYDVTFTPREA